MFHINSLKLIRKTFSNMETFKERDKIRKTYLKWVSYQIQFQNYKCFKKKHTRISILNYIYFCYINNNNNN